MQWILFNQTPVGDFINYVSSENDQYPKYIGIKEFYKILLDYDIKNKKDLKIRIEYFDIIFIDLNTGIWEVKKIDYQPATFEDLWKLNKPKEPEKNKLAKSKDFIKNFSRRNRNKI